MNTFIVNDFTPTTLMLFGEAYSKGGHLFHVPLRADMLASEDRRYRDLALTAMAALSGSERLNEGLRDNADSAFDEIEYDPIHRHSLGVTPQGIIYFHNLLSRGSGTGEGLGLKDYQAVFAQLQSLCDRLNRPAFESSSPERSFTLIFTKAVLLHLSLVTASLFPAGNAASAAVLQHGVLLETGMMPRRYAYLLTVFYGSCSDQYHAELDRADRTGDATAFVDFSIRGFVGQLRQEMEALRFVWPEQRARVGWFNYVHAVLSERSDEGTRRQITLAGSMPDTPTSPLRLGELVGTLYGNDRAGQDLLRSDLTALTEHGLAQEGTDGWRPSRHLLDD
jgi:hypothetical protein